MKSTILPGLLRKNESTNVVESLRNIGLEIKVLNCSDEFLNATTTVRNADNTGTFETLPLCYAIDPEDKRNIIGDTFVKVANEAIRELGLDPNEIFLALGSLRISSNETVNNTYVKTGHCDSELACVLRAAGRVLEPLIGFLKDEVRQLGRDLGLPESLVSRHPFPGPGLAVRILCTSEPYMEKDFSDVQVYDLILNYLLVSFGRIYFSGHCGSNRRIQRQLAKAFFTPGSSHQCYHKRRAE